MKRSGFGLALSALACAAATAALTIGCYFDVFLGAGYVIAVFALMVPLSKECYFTDMLAAFAASILAALFGAGGVPFAILPFAAFFGLHPLLNALERKYVKRRGLRVLTFFPKAVWFDLALLVAWFALGETFGVTGAVWWYSFVAKYLYLVVFLGGTAAFAVYDILIKLCQRSVDRLIKRIGR